MIIYTHARILFIHSTEIIRMGRIRIADTSGNIVGEFSMNGVDFGSFPLEIPEGKYLVLFRSEGETARKTIYIT
jgi:hypothetical protein